MITLAPPLPATALDAEALVRAVCLRVAPLWGLRDLVAVNPYLGHADAGLLAAEDAMQRSQHAAVLPSWEPLRRAWQAGKFALDDVAAARSEVGASDRHPVGRAPQQCWHRCRGWRPRRWRRDLQAETGTWRVILSTNGWDSTLVSDLPRRTGYLPIQPARRRTSTSRR